MISRKSAPVFVLLLFFFASPGCIGDEIPSEDNDTAGAGVPVEPETPEEAHNATLKKTEILSFDNGYSLKVLEINRKDGYTVISLRKDEQEYSRKTISLNRTYGVPDPENRYTVYSVRLDKIYDNSFLIELTYIVEPEISIEVNLTEDSSQPGPVIELGKDSITRTYEWEYDETEFWLQCEYDRDAYEAYSERTRNRKWTHFVNDPYDDEFIARITTQLKNLADEGNYGSDEIPYIAMLFVQSLPYVSDDISSGYDEYPRFPFETMYYGGGDCEDSSILLAAILHEMGYGVALIELPGHMAAGIKGNDGLSGSYYEYGGTKYFYLETTDSGWAVGQIPDEFENDKATVTPIYSGYPEAIIEFTGSGRSNALYSYIDLDIRVENVGSEDAEDVIIYVAVEATEDGMVWDEIISEVIPEMDVDERISYAVSNLRVPAGETYRLGVRVGGSNMDTEYVHSEWVIA
jgi:hypothetical protein